MSDKIAHSFSIFAMVTLITCSNIYGQQNDKEEVIKIIDSFHKALATGDSTSALGYLAEDVIILESGGLENKDHYRSGHLAGDIRFAQAVPRKRSEIQV